MNLHFVNLTMAVGAVIAAIAIGSVCFVGLVVWLGGWSWKAPKQAK
jgi:ABC-type transport system involved in cytochrome c biogenesis permease subunit